ncbi:MAG: condensation domain-containing protein [Chloroflexi bacterium]|nr:condensation domain-containing protein [Chloroflexota bacterium]
MNPENIQDLYTLTPTQRAILFHTLYAPETGVYVEQNAVEIHDLDVACFIQAWQQVIQRHAALRTAFFWEEVEEPLQVVAKELSLPLTQLDWRGLDDTQQMTQLEDLMAAERQQGFALSVPPLFRLYLMQLDENRHFFSSISIIFCMTAGLIL